MYCTDLLSHHTVVWGYLVYCVFVCHFGFCLFLCTVTDFSAAEKAKDVRYCTRVGLLSRQVFSTFGEHWLAGSHEGGGITARMNPQYETLFGWPMCVSRHKYRSQRQRSVGIQNWRRRCRL